MMNRIDPNGEFDNIEYPDDLIDVPRKDVMFDEEFSYDSSSDDDVEDVPIIDNHQPTERTQQQPLIDNDIAPTPLQTPQHSQHPPIRQPVSFHSPDSEPQHHQIRQALSFETPQLEASPEPQLVPEPQVVPEPQRQSARIISPVDFKKKKLTQALIASFMPSTAVKKAQKLTSKDAALYARYAAILSKNTDMSHEEIMSKPFARLRREAGKYESV
jgi:hypothetical protein